MYSEWTRASSQAPAHTAPKLIVPPTAEPFSLAEAKLHCRIDTDDDNGNVVKWIRAARTKVERDTGRAMLTQTWDLFLDAFYAWAATPYTFGLPRFPYQAIRIPFPPLQSVTSVNQTDTNNAETIWPASNYVVDTASEPGRIALSDGGSWPIGLRVFQPGRIRFVAGYTDPALIPSDLMEAMALLIGVFSENREPILLRKGQTESTLYDDLISNYVIYAAA